MSEEDEGDGMIGGKGAKKEKAGNDISRRRNRWLSSQFTVDKRGRT